MNFLLILGILLSAGQTMRMVRSHYRRLEVISFIIMVALMVACGMLGLFHK